MGVTSIEWTALCRPDGTHAPGYTFNPWRGCTRVSEGCRSCYAEKMSHRNPTVLGEWGPDGKRALAAESYWKQPLKWNRDAKNADEHRRVFCASLADVFEDRPELEDPRSRLRWLMFETPHLDWLLLTKRPAFARRWIEDHLWPTNCWLGVSVEDRRRADERIPELLKIPAAVRFLSIEPLLEPLGEIDLRGIHWVIVGGESGHYARPCDMAWVRSIIEQCRAAGVACFVKQLGARPFDSDAMRGVPGSGVLMTIEESRTPESLAVLGACLEASEVRLRDPKGGAWDEWPEDLRIREFSEVAP